MIKFETIGMLDRVVVDPTIKIQATVSNYAFITYNDQLYLVDNPLTPDKPNTEGRQFAAGECLYGSLVKSLDGQKLVIDGKHIDGGLTNIAVGDILVVGDDGLLEPGTITDAGVYFLVTDLNARLTERAIKAKIFLSAAVQG